MRHIDWVGYRPAVLILAATGMADELPGFIPHRDLWRELLELQLVDRPDG